MECYNASTPRQEVQQYEGEWLEEDSDPFTISELKEVLGSLVFLGSPRSGAADVEAQLEIFRHRSNRSIYELIHLANQLHFFAVNDFVMAALNYVEGGIPVDQFKRLPRYYSSLHRLLFASAMNYYSSTAVVRILGEHMNKWRHRYPFSVVGLWTHGYNASSTRELYWAFTGEFGPAFNFSYIEAEGVISRLRFPEGTSVIEATALADLSTGVRDFEDKRWVTLPAELRHRVEYKERILAKERKLKQEIAELLD